MINLPIHLPSIIIGFFIGYAVIGALWIHDATNDRGDFAKGFDRGWECRENLEKEMKKEQSCAKDMRGEQDG